MFNFNALFCVAARTVKILWFFPAKRCIESPECDCRNTFCLTPILNRSCIDISPDSGFVMYAHCASAFVEQTWIDHTVLACSTCLHGTLICRQDNQWSIKACFRHKWATKTCCGAVLLNRETNWEIVPAKAFQEISRKTGKPLGFAFVLYKCVNSYYCKIY